MRFALLASGSRGNCTLVCAGRTRVLLDCGLGLAETRRRLERLAVEPETLDAIVVTHEHSDHLAGVGPLARRYRVPVWMTAGTRAGWRERATDHNGSAPEVHGFTPDAPFTIGDLRITPYPVPHDAREPCQMVFDDGRSRLGVLSDAGHITPHIRANLSGCDGLLLEFNHDPDMLARGAYPPALKRRVGGDWGHLSNAQSGALLRALGRSRLQHLVLTHLSEKNNTPALAVAAAAEALSCDPDWVACASQEGGLGWRELA